MTPSFSIACSCCANASSGIRDAMSSYASVERMVGLMPFLARSHAAANALSPPPRMRTRFPLDGRGRTGGFLVALAAQHRSSSGILMLPPRSLRRHVSIHEPSHKLAVICGIGMLLYKTAHASLILPAANFLQKVRTSMCRGHWAWQCGASSCVHCASHWRSSCCSIALY